MIEFTTFSGWMFCFDEELLNWLNKSTKLGGVSKSTEVSLLETFNVTFIKYWGTEIFVCQISE